MTITTTPDKASVIFIMRLRNSLLDCNFTMDALCLETWNCHVDLEVAVYNQELEQMYIYHVAKNVHHMLIKYSSRLQLLQFSRYLCKNLWFLFYAFL